MSLVIDPLVVGSYLQLASDTDLEVGAHGNPMLLVRLGLTLSSLTSHLIGDALALLVGVCYGSRISQKPAIDHQAGNLLHSG